MEFRGLMGGLYRISEWIMRLSVINVLWVICSFPFFYLVFAGLIAASQSIDFWKQSAVMIGIVTPFTLFPATGAMFTVARKWVTGDDDVPLFKTYFRGYKENYRQSMFGGLVFVLFSTIIYINYTFYVGQSGTLSLLSILFIVLTIVMFAAMFHFFSIMVHFHMKFWQIIKNCMLITIGNPVMTIFLLTVNGIVIYVSVNHFTFLIPFFMGSIMATVSFFVFYRIFDRMKTLNESKLEEEQEEKADEDKQAEESGEVREQDETVKTDGAKPNSDANGRKPLE
ncbi:MAG: rane protein [Paenibacillus sp.]|nr:rane protein [Paenibacillus sp.]